MFIRPQNTKSHKSHYTKSQLTSSFHYQKMKNLKNNEVNSKKGQETPTKTNFDRYLWGHPLTNY